MRRRARAVLRPTGSDEDETGRRARSPTRAFAKAAARLKPALRSTAAFRRAQWRRNRHVRLWWRRWFGIFVRAWLSIRTARPRRLPRFFRFLSAHPRFARRGVLPLPPLRSNARVALFLGVDELLSRIPVLPAGSPVPVAALLTFGPRVPGFLLRLPEPAAREPFHRGIGMLLFDPLKGRQQLFTIRCSESRRQSTGDDGPVRVTRRHTQILA
jgi:hypothetical protein